MSINILPFLSLNILQIKAAAAVSNVRSSLPFDVIIYILEPLWMFNLWRTWWLSLLLMPNPLTLKGCKLEDEISVCLF